MQERLAATRARLLDAALGVVADGGYGGCSMAAVARAAEVFRLACAREVAAAVAAAEENARAGGSHVDGVLAAVRMFAGRAVLSGTLAYALIIEPVDALVDAERLIFRESYRDLLAVQIQAAIVAGEIPAQDATLTAAGIIGAIGEALVLPLAKRDTDPHVLTSMTDFTRRCLGGTNVQHS
jgi:AcrR family transcriptional regulator